jgi:hypothetical protein
MTMGKGEKKGRLKSGERIYFLFYFFLGERNKERR